MMKFYIVLRFTEDWGSLDIDKYFAEDRPHQDKDPDHMAQIRTNIDRWDKLEVNFFQYRQEVKRLAMKCWNIEHISIKEALEIKDPNVVFIPLDDDDILHPDLSDELNNIYGLPNIHSVTWNTWSYSMLKCGPMFIKDHENYFKEQLYASLIQTNCYSIRSDFATKELLERHDKFSWIRYINRFHLAKELGVRFVHPGSTWQMQRRNTTLLGNLHSKLQKRPEGLNWAKGFIADTTLLTLPNFQKTS